ncbi:MAG: hypothetical protein ACYC64_17720, partial [Armatimonadota bacterium]
CIPILISACASLLEAGAQCGKSARWDLCGGQEAISVPTATCLSGGNVSSTKQPKTRFLSAENASDVIASVFAILRTDFVHDGDVAAVQSFGRTSANLPDIAPSDSLLGLFFSEFSGLGPSESTAFSSTSLQFFAAVCWVTPGVANSQ